MIVMIHLVITALCAFECLCALANIRGKLPKLIIFGGMGIIHGIVPVLTPVGLRWSGLSESTHTHAAFLALIGMIMLSLGWRLFERFHVQWPGLSPGLLKAIESPSGQRWLRRIFWTTSVLSVTAWLVSLVASAGSLQAALHAGRFQYRGEGQVYWRAILQHVASLIVMPGFVCFFLPRRYWLIGVVFAITATAFVFWSSQGARGLSLGVLGGMVLGYSFRHKFAVHRFILLVICSAAIVLLSTSMYEARKVMAKASFGEIVGIVFSAETYREALSRDPLNYHQILAAAVEHFPRDHPYLNGATYRRILMFYLPRTYFSSIKPADTHNTFAEVVQGKRTTNTIPPTMIGDGYINFWGFPGVVITMFINGILFAYASQKMREHMLFFLVFGAPFIRLALLAIRGSPYEIMALLISGTVLVWMLSLGTGLSFVTTQQMIRKTNYDASSPTRRTRPKRIGSGSKRSRQGFLGVDQRA